MIARERFQGVIGDQAAVWREQRAVAVQARTQTQGCVRGLQA